MKRIVDSKLQFWKNSVSSGTALKDSLFFDGLLFWADPYQRRKCVIVDLHRRADSYELLYSSLLVL